MGKDVSGLKTLYGYDDFGWLRCVVPPKAVSLMGASFDPFTANDLLFAYDYDQRGRMTRKKVPGAGVTTMSYDTRDRLVSSTDANNTTIITSYDELDRVVSTQQGSTVLTQTMYDGYGSDAKSFESAHAYGVANRDKVKGVVTGTKTLVLGSSTYLTSSTYYDELGRAIQTVSDNSKGGLDRSSSRLDFVGRVLESKLTTTNSSTSITVDNRTAYEQGGRVKSVCQKVSDNQQTPISNTTLAYWEPVARHTYNGIGELTKKTLGCGIQNIEYQYQMRGWLTALNDPGDLNKGFAPADKHFFGMKLAYDGVGNISDWTYRNAQTNYGPPYDLSQQAPYQYGFTYDNLNRLTSGTLTQQGQTKFTLSNLSYDQNGNIQTLNRALGGATDQLTYSYKSNSNQLASVVDGGSADFAKSSSYAYDGNGNLTQDGAKNITGISYNYLNLLSTISRSSGGNVSYTYSAIGQKLSASFPAVGSTPAKRYDYVGGLVYENDQLEFIPTAEGRVLPPGRASTTVTTGSSTSIIASNSFYRYEYHLKDHLGNLRVACRCGERQNETSPGDSYEPLVVQEQHYDPFGLDLTNLNSQMGVTASRLKYNGKEEQPGLGWIDYGARMYDPAIGRWHGVDALIEKFYPLSGYSYVANNPILLNDPNGKDWTITKTEDKEGRAHFQITFTGAVLNSSSQKFDIVNFAKAVKNQTERLFNLGEKKADGTADFIVTANIQIRVVNDREELKENESLIQVKDGSDEDFQVYNSLNTSVVAKAMNGKEVSVNADFIGDIISGKNNKTMAHELGHTGGLKHPLMDVREYFFGMIKQKGETYDSPKSNFMYQGTVRNPTGPTRDQVERIYRLYRSGGLNKASGVHPVKND